MNSLSKSQLNTTSVKCSNCNRVVDNSVFYIGVTPTSQMVRIGKHCICSSCCYEVLNKVKHHIPEVILDNILNSKNRFETGV